MISKTRFKNLIVIKKDKYTDKRGYFIEIVRNNVIKKNFPFLVMSFSKKNVLRGIHGDNKTWKLISCLYGEFYLVVVNNDKKSKNFKKHILIKVSDKNRLQVLVPPKHGNGHLVTSNEAIFHYKQTTEYDRKSQFTIKWNDKTLNINWPIKKPILSKRDNFEDI